MSAREFAPGTVAVATVRGVGGVRVMRYAEPGGCVDWFASGVVEGSTGHRDEHVTDVRPLVVLDLDGQDVPSLLRHLRGSPGCHFCAPMADQIEEQTRDPKPAEPTGLGAVVEDSRGHWWLRKDACRAGSSWFDADDHAIAQPWREVDVTRVLSEGVERAPEAGEGA